MSASFFSLQSDVNKSTNLFFGRTQLGMDVGVAFNSTLVRNSLAECYYITDGASSGRYNGGCGCLADKQYRNCQSEFSPYKNIAPPPYSGKAYGGTQFGDKCTCKDPKLAENDQPDQSHGSMSCFWRGPALKLGNHRVWNGSEFDEAMAQRHNFPFSDYDDKTHGMIARRWTEVVLNTGLVHEKMRQDPGATAWAVYYNDPPKFHQPVDQVISIAKGLQAQLHARYHVELPLVRIAMNEPVSAEKGPFSEHSEHAAADKLIAV